MNTTTTIILITEIIFTGLILCGLTFCIIKINTLTKKVNSLNKRLRTILPTAKDILKLTHEYIELGKKEFMKKIEASGNLIGEVVVYYLMHKIFKNHFDKFDAGFSLAKLFWS